MTAGAIAEGKHSIFLVFEYMEHDLLGLISRKIKFGLPQFKFIALQLLLGLKSLHDEGIIHRDIKCNIFHNLAANILANKHGEVKVGDFGLGRQMCDKAKPLTIKVMTMIYRAPEVLLGMVNYTTKVDMWGLGCVLVEVLIGEPLFCTAKTPQHLIDQIFTRMGTPTEESWPGVTALQYYQELNPKKPPYDGNITNYIFKKNPKADRASVDFAVWMLTLNPDKRPSTDEALNHIFLVNSPIACTKDEMPKVEKECHELEIRKLIMQKREREKQAMLNQANQMQARKTQPGMGMMPGTGHQGQHTGNPFFANHNQFRR